MVSEQPDFTLLLVDDEPNILSSLKRVFRSEGYRIIMAQSAVQGLEYLKTTTIDLVISDMRMPEMDGAEFLAVVAAKWPDTVRILLTGFSDIASTIEAINKGKIYRYISKPWEDNDLKLTVGQALEQKFLERERRRLETLTQKQNAELRDLNANLEDKVAQRTKELEDAHESLKKSYASSIKVFSTLLEKRAGALAGHSRRVSEHARSLGMRMGLETATVQSLIFAGLLHDIGKIGLPDRLMTRAFNDLTAEERRQVMNHAAIGQAIVMAMEPLQEAARYIACHHEYIDGSGYPNGLRGDEIPLGAKILTVVNDYDALQIGSLTTQCCSPMQAKKYLIENKGKKYDGRVVDAFLDFIDWLEQQKFGENTMSVVTADLKPGMVLAKDLLTESGILLLSKDYLIDEKLIARLRTQEETLKTRFKLLVYKRKLSDSH
jgi:response regulator RpfG family c-di-GMP phosphodiesterase